MSKPAKRLSCTLCMRVHETNGAPGEVVPERCGACGAGMLRIDDGDGADASLHAREPETAMSTPPGGQRTERDGRDETEGQASLAYDGDVDDDFDPIFSCK
jgi:hypothetical protein